MVFLFVCYFLLLGQKSFVISCWCMSRVPIWPKLIPTRMVLTAYCYPVLEMIIHSISYCAIFIWSELRWVAAVVFICLFVCLLFIYLSANINRVAYIIFFLLLSGVCSWSKMAPQWYDIIGKHFPCHCWIQKLQLQILFFYYLWLLSYQSCDKTNLWHQLCFLML